LRCDRLAVGYRGDPVAAALDVSLERGAYLGIVGPNGCGKTTFLKTVLGILPPLSGSVSWSGGRLPRVGYVPQRDAIDSIYPFRAIEVVLLALGIEEVFRPTHTERDVERARHALGRVGLADRAEVGYSELSGGQRQRVLVARALATEPELLALDEPTSGMDPGSTERLLDLVDSIRAERAITVMLVTHDLSIVARRATHALAMHEGRHATGTVAEVFAGDQLQRLFCHPLALVDAGGRPTVVPRPRTGT